MKRFSDFINRKPVVAAILAAIAGAASVALGTGDLSKASSLFLTAITQLL